MKLVKVLNNNVVIARDNNGNDCVVFGIGISFQTKIGEEIPKEKIEKIFSSAKEKNQLEKLIDSIPQKYFELSVEIIDYIQNYLNIKLSSSIYFTLTDHISFIKERIDKGIMPNNSLKRVVKRYYPNEYKVSVKVVELLEDEFDCELNEDEVASIALHIINAETENTSISDSIKMVKLVDQILQIIKYQTKVEIDEDDLNYQRLVTHVEFFIQRVLKNNMIDENNPLFELVKKNYPKSYKISLKIKEFVEKKLEYQVNNDELTYLIIHIQRILSIKENIS